MSDVVAAIRAAIDDTERRATEDAGGQELLNHVAVARKILELLDDARERQSWDGEAYMNTLVETLSECYGIEVPTEQEADRHGS